uniref:Uncharacterized protein n=1 Tax=Romanomermis culicivorax TaxID=13658 RepID=A0A915K8Y8_ROMCU
MESTTDIMPTVLLTKNISSKYSLCQALLQSGRQNFRIFRSIDPSQNANFFITSRQSRIVGGDPGVVPLNDIADENRNDNVKREPCDYRMDKKTGEIYFLEINCLPGVFYPRSHYGSADFILDHENKFQFFLENLLKCAWRNFRDEKRRSPIDRVTTVNGPICGFLTSKKILRKSEPIVDLTLLPNRLVNRNEFDRFPDEVRKFFDPTSVPITKNLRLWLYNAGQNRREFEVTAIKRSSSQAEVNCTLDTNLTLVAIRDIAENEMFVLGENFA